MTLNNPHIIDRASSDQQPLALRAVADADQTFLAELYAASRPELDGLRCQGDVFNQLIAMQQRVQLAGLLQNFPTAQQLVIESNQQPLGRLVVDWGDKDIRVVDIAVVTSVRRSGVANAVLRALQHAAAAEGLRLSLAVAISNAPAQALYHGLGFQREQQDALFDQLVWQATP